MSAPTRRYHAAARRLLDYLGSPERRELVPDALDEAVLGARVSVDFYRHGVRVPPDRTEHGWTALVLWICRNESEPELIHGRAGTLHVVTSRLEQPVPAGKRTRAPVRHGEPAGYPLRSSRPSAGSER